MTHRPQHHLNPFIVYTDAMMLVVATFSLLISMLLVSVAAIANKTTPAEKPKAEYLVNLRWDDKRDVDLDLWMRVPDGSVIYYNNRETPNVSLDRDSRGYVSNRTRLPDGSSVYSSNHEVIAVRAVIPGDYLVAVSYYTGDAEGIDATVDVEKVNPTLKEVAAKHIHFDKVKQAMDVVKFRIEKADGEVTLLPLPAEDLVREHTRTNPNDGNFTSPGGVR